MNSAQYDDWHFKIIAEARGELIKAGMALYPTFRRAATAIRKAREYYFLLRYPGVALPSD